MPDIELTDYQAAEQVRDGKLPSPSKYGDFWLFDLRITGTGAAYRDKLDEYAYRDQKLWQSDEFLKRCNGLPVIFEHPEKSGLNSDEFRERSIGTVMIPYVKGEDVWGVSKIFDADAALLMQSTHRSTSPGVTPTKGSIPTTTESGKKVLTEGLPLILDHLAICENGVWDKAGPPEGVRLDAKSKEQSVTAEERNKLEEERDAALRRADAAEAKMKEHEDKARRDAAAMEAADKVRKDAEESERKAIEVAEKAKADRKARHDAVRLDGESEEAWATRKAEARKDETEEERKEREAREVKAKADKGRKDAAPEEDVDANQIKELEDARKADSKRIESLEAQLSTLTRQPSIEDRNAIAAAFHRADATYQMLGEPPPLSLPGESSIAYRRRLADGLRKHSASWREHPIHDSINGPAFDLIENAIYNDALAVAKNPPINDSVGRLREIVTQQNGKTKVEFVGDSRVAWAPFMPPSHSFVKFDNRAGRRD